jgi:hypothetical protein
VLDPADAVSMSPAQLAALLAHLKANPDQLSLYTLLARAGPHRPEVRCAAGAGAAGGCRVCAGLCVKSKRAPAAGHGPVLTRTALALPALRQLSASRWR